MGTEIEKHASLEIDEYYPLHVRAWRIKRIGWIFVLLILIAGLAGFLGPGPFSKTSKEGPAGLRLEYERITRYNAPAHLRVQIPPAGNPVELSINSEFLRKISVERVDPEPTEMRLAGDRHTWIFANAQPNAPSEVRITFRPERFGPALARLEFAGIGVLEFKPFFLP